MVYSILFKCMFYVLVFHQYKSFLGYKQFVQERGIFVTLNGIQGKMNQSQRKKL